MGIEELTARQAGVVALRQALEAGETEHAITGRLRRREWVPVHPGVYVDHAHDHLLDHPDAPTWLQRAWAAVLLAWPAALCHLSALRLADGPGRRDAGESVIHVAVDRHSHFDPPLGVRAHRLDGLGHRVRWDLSPPRVRTEEVVLGLAAQAGDATVTVGRLGEALRARRTTAERLLEALDSAPDLPRRALLADCLERLHDGATPRDVMRIVGSRPRSA